MTRGQALDYASATEVQSLNAYTETMLGIFRKKMDKAVAQMLRIYQRVLAHVMDTQGEGGVKELKVYHNYTELTVKREWLDLRWDIKLKDFASTPQAEATRRLEFQQVMPAVLQLAEQLNVPDELNPERLSYACLLSRRMLDYIVDLYSLPDDWRFANLEKSRQFAEPDVAPPPEPEPAPTPEAQMAEQPVDPAMAEADALTQAVGAVNGAYRAGGA